MSPPSCPSEVGALLALDASTAINLNATGRAPDILSCFKGQVVLPDIVLGELEDGLLKGRCDAELTKQLIDAGLVQVVSLSESGLAGFEELVIGEAAVTLDDGEAATIAYAIEAGAVAVIDERKARRICTERFQHLRLATTVDLLAHEAVERAIGRTALSNAVYSALIEARMRVRSHHVAWIVDLIGADRAKECQSLPRSARVARQVKGLV
jgi:predicted nucleic acid-binding protein